MAAVRRRLWWRVSILSILLILSIDYATSASWTMEHEALTQTIIGCAIAVHRTMGSGYLESVYRNALAHELRKAQIRFECEKKLKVVYDGVVVGDFAADMVVENVVLVENKAVQSLAAAHEVQIVNYLTATGLDIGLLLNFGSEKLEIKRKYRTFKGRPKDMKDFVL